MSIRGILMLAGWTSFSSVAFAQQFAPTTVQLPTFSTFAVSTTVSVPDSGWGHAHRIGQFSHGRTTFFPVWGASTVCWQEVDQFSAWSVGAQSIDLSAFDAQVLASAPLAVPPHPIGKQIAAARNSSAAFVPGSVADARRARAADLAAKLGEIDELVAKADALIREGKSNVARVYLQMAAGKSTGDRKSQLERRAAALKQRPRH